MLNALQINEKKFVPYRPFHRAIDEALKISKKVMAVSVSEIYQSIAVQLYQPTLIRWLSRLCVYKQTSFV